MATFSEEYQKIEDDFKCGHSSLSVRTKPMSDGRIQICKQCQKCGQGVGGALPQKGLDINGIPSWDYDLERKWKEEKDKRKAALVKAHETEMPSYIHSSHFDNQEWNDRYQEYLQSEQWRELRHLVLTRDGHKCQNCFCQVETAFGVHDQIANIHHLSYEGYNRHGYSFAWECITLCRSCHMDWHGKRGEISELFYEENAIEIFSSMGL